MKKTLGILIFFICAMTVMAESPLTINNVHFKMNLTDGDGGENEFIDQCVNDSSHSAPIEVYFTAYMTDNSGNEVSGVTFTGQWRMWREANTTKGTSATGDILTPELVRTDNPTEYYCGEGDVYNFAFVGKAIPAGGDTIEITEEDASNHIFTVKSATSVLKFPNAFSPNGDGYNDIFKAKSGYKSIVEFHAAIYSRWGQKLYEWDNPAGGWDGSWNGHPVKDGVYYVQVKARGADGTIYNIKRDVNLMTGYNKTDTDTSSSGTTE